VFADLDRLLFALLEVLNVLEHVKNRIDVDVPAKERLVEKQEQNRTDLVSFLAS
jgi:hypothetical protein